MQIEESSLDMLIYGLVLGNTTFYFWRASKIDTRGHMVSRTCPFGGWIHFIAPSFPFFSEAKHPIRPIRSNESTEDIIDSTDQHQFDDNIPTILPLSHRSIVYNFLNFRFRSRFISKNLETWSRIGGNLKQDECISDVHLGFTSRIIKFISRIPRSIYYL